MEKSNFKYHIRLMMKEEWSKHDIKGVITVLKKAIAKSQSISLDKFIFSIGIRYIGQENAKILSENIIDIDVVDSDSKWFGVTYKEDKDNSVKKLDSYTRDGIYPTPLWI